MDILKLFKRNNDGGAWDPFKTGAGSGAPKKKRRRGLVRGGRAPLQILTDVLLLLAAAGALAWCICSMIPSGELISVTLISDGTTASYITSASTVGEFLLKQGVSLDTDDVVEPASINPLHDGDTVEVTRAFPVAVESAGHVTVLKMTGGTVGTALQLAGVGYDADDELSSLAFEDVEPGMQIEHNDVEIKYTTNNKTITYQQEVIKDDSEYESFKEVEQAGSDGSKRITQRVTIKNGVEVSREIVDQTVLVPAVTEVVRVGTKIRYQTNYVGEWRRYMDRPVAGVGGWVAMTVYRVTAYCTGSRTATGTKPKLGTVAVNTKYIPYGTKIWIKGYGLGTASDTGAFRNYASPKDNAIDIWFNTEKEARAWGSKYSFTILVKIG